MMGMSMSYKDALRERWKPAAVCPLTRSISTLFILRLLEGSTGEDEHEEDDDKHADDAEDDKRLPALKPRTREGLNLGLPGDGRWYDSLPIPC